MDDPLVPLNTGPATDSVSAQSLRLNEIDPSSITGIWDAWRCPANVLPWLAWAMSVDVWDEDWHEIQKRKAIAESPEYHRLKGTRRAVDIALGLIERPFEFSEWSDQVPLGRRGTSRLFVTALLSDVWWLLPKTKRLVYNAKPKARPVWIGVGEMASSPLYIGAGVLEENLTVIEVYAYAGEDIETNVIVAPGLLDESLTTIEAK